MHKEILTHRQIELLDLISDFSKQFYLVGGTAIALHIGHRQSIDFDLFSEKSIKPNTIKNQLTKNGYEFKIIYEEFEQIHLLISSVKITFFTYPYKINANIWFNKIIQMPSLITLAAMKAYALGGRAKWKDYVDMYFLIKNNFSVEEIEQEAANVYGDKFSAKLFRQQLAYFNDIDYTEKVNYIKENPKDEDIKEFLINNVTFL